MGFNAKAGYYGTTVGAMSEARDFSVAIGRSANVWANNAVAIGYGTWAREEHSVAIGSQAETEEPGQVMFGTPPNHPQDGQVLNLKTYGTMQAADFLDADGNSIVGGGGSEIPFEEGVVSLRGLEIATDSITGEWGHEVFAKEGGLKLDGGHASGKSGSYARFTTFNFDPYTLSQGYVQYCYDTDDNGVESPSSVYDNSTWAVWEHHNAPVSDFNVRMWGGRNAGKRAGIGAPWGRCDFWEGHFSEVYAESYLDKDGNAMMSISDVIDGFSAVQQAVSDEITVEGLRDAIANAMGGFIERLEARQAEVQAKVKKSADDYHELMEAHYQKTQEEKANVSNKSEEEGKSQ